MKEISQFAEFAKAKITHMLSHIVMICNINNIDVSALEFVYMVAPFLFIFASIRDAGTTPTILTR